MNKEILKRLFRSIDGKADDDLVKVAYEIVKEESLQGHHLLSKQLKAILDQNVSIDHQLSKELKDIFGSASKENGKAQTSLAISVPRNSLRHNMILSTEVEAKFQRIEKEFVAKERLAHHGLKPKQKILLYGSPGCGKSMGAERLAWNIGLPFLKVRFEAVISSYLGQSLSNLKKLFDGIADYPCVLLLDEFDIIAKSRTYGHDVGEMHRLVNMILFLLEEYNAPGLLIATTNLETSLDKAVFRRFDEVFEIPRPNQKEILGLLEMTLSAMDLEKGLKLNGYIDKMNGFSAAQVVKVAQNASKLSVLDNSKVVRKSDFDIALIELSRLNEDH